MKPSSVRDTFRRIQDILREELGAALRGAGAKRLESALASLAGGELTRPAVDDVAHRDVTILLADLRGFSAIASTYPADLMLQLLNRCFGKMGEVIDRHQGTIDKFMGDAIMVVFSGDGMAAGEDAKQALLCAVEMQIAMNELRERHQEEEVPEMYMGIGINTGKVVAGMVGSELHRTYTVIGETVNLAARIEAFSLRGQILASQATHERCPGFATAGDLVTIHVKGKADRLCIREVVAIPSHGKVVPRQERRRSPRVEVKLPFSYQVLHNKIVIAGVMRGVVHDIGYHGVLAEVNRPLSLYTEIKLDLELPLVAYRASDIYARVVKVSEKDSRHFIGVEFTSLSGESASRIQQLVQMLM